MVAARLIGLAGREGTRMAPSVTPSPPGRPHEPSAETRGDHGRGRPDMHVEMELQKRALELLVAASRRSDVDRTGRRHEHVLVRRRWRLRASRKNQQGRSRERQRQQDYESPHRSHLSPGTRTGFIYRTASSCATARSCSPHVGQGLAQYVRFTTRKGTGRSLAASDPALLGLVPSVSNGKTLAVCQTARRGVVPVAAAGLRPQ
jgi:hypothetical protein